MTDGKKFFDQPIKNNKGTYENIRKLLLAKEMIVQPVVCQTISTLKFITNRLQQI